MIKSDKDILIVGLGLIGGSIAKALRNFTTGVIAALDTNNSVLKAAQSEGVIDRVQDSGGELPYDIVILCIYPSQIPDFLRSHKLEFRNGAIVTDATGVKSWLLENIRDLIPENVDYISGHPMAGSEKSGYANSLADMFKNANYLLIPTHDSLPENIAVLEKMALAIGCRKVTVTDAPTHDRMVAFVSEMPHVIAAAVGGSPLMDTAADFTGNSLKDITRVALFNEVLWSELFIENREFIVPQIDEFIAGLNNIKQSIVSSDKAKLMDILKNCKKLEK